VKRFWPFSFYFLYFAALAAFAPYIVLYWQSLGFSGPQIGLLTFIPPLVTLVAAPIWTGFADARRAHRLLMALAIAGIAVLVAVLPAVSTFGAALLLSPLAAFFMAPIVSMSDAATMNLLAQEGRPQMYGRLRLGGTFGWAIAAPLVGVLVAARGIPWAFWTYAAVMILALLVSLQLSYPAHTQRVSVWRGMAGLLRKSEWVFFLLIGVVTGMGFASVNSYLFAYLKELNIGTALAGLALTISTVSEIPIMFFANRILGRLGSRGMLTLAMGATGFRLLAYAAFTTPAGILLLQLVNGLTFPMFWIAGVAYASERAPQGMQASAQGLFGAATTGIGAALGGLLGGILIASVGGRAMYTIFGAIVLAGLVILTVLERRTAPAKT
jgi:MFS transporter, PPP family, 3-phenylpropionic acid transporter